jgi:hypothetical protein
MYAIHFIALSSPVALRRLSQPFQTHVCTLAPAASINVWHTFHSFIQPRRTEAPLAKYVQTHVCTLAPAASINVWHTFHSFIQPSRSDAHVYTGTRGDNTCMAKLSKLYPAQSFRRTYRSDAHVHTATPGDNTCMAKFS